MRSINAVDLLVEREFVIFRNAMNEVSVPDSYRAVTKGNTFR